ncbi:dihydrodipicolinate synthase family protein [Mumia sp. zg.B17]|uniref:dihydrodipicolinate synthase family protein n=1 Tax=Mumia sp. zg.B17 TaxID=2855446 RepID=UPI001C6F3B03|nr:dihydrodipicolinate synthase family protein [Mumia sp. zg.B17]MBW9205319.1 dihydrodipicolinate synthase family protein [Mumia sp. zg.B17]
MNVTLEPGLWGVLATPFDTAFALDLPSLQREVGSFVADGCDGLVALGVFGEAAALSDDEAVAVARTVAASTDLPYVLGLSERDPEQVVRQADRLLASVPRPPVAVMAQINDPDPGSVAASLRRLHEETGSAVLLQDYPVVSGITVPDETVVAIARACPFVVGVKSETPPTSLAVARLTAALDVPIFGGLGGVGLLDELMAGSAGAMTGFSHPAALAAVLRSYRDTGFEDARAQWAPWLPLATFEGQVGIGLSIRKELLHRRGILGTSRVRPPARALPPELVPLLERHLATVPASGPLSSAL